MITQQDLQEAIAECLGVRNPNASTCIKLAAFLTIREHLYGERSEDTELPEYSFAGGPSEQVGKTITYRSDTEFSAAINGRNADEVWPVLDELMSVLQATNPRLYAGVMRKIEV